MSFIVGLEHKGRHINVGFALAMPPEDWLVPTGTFDSTGDNFNSLHYKPDGSFYAEAWPRNGSLSNGSWNFHSTDILSKVTKASVVIDALAEIIAPGNLLTAAVQTAAVKKYLDGSY